jgi:hypothetical protein
MIKMKCCALCNSSDELELSHIVPKMVVRTLKKTSVGNIRNTNNPNMTVQDSEKRYMLCGCCEDLFSDKETYFSNTIFYPYLTERKTKFDYNEKLFYFLTSVSWRSLYLNLLDFVENSIVGIDALECLISSEKTMKEYLLQKRSDIGDIENHIYFFEDIKEIQNDDKNFRQLRPHATFHRGITSYTFCYEKEGTYGTITNMMGIVIFTLYKLGKKERWEKTKVENGMGHIEAKEQRITSVTGNELIHIMKTAQAASESMSAAQQQKAKERVRKVGELIKDTAVYKDWINDNRIAQGDSDLL